MSGPGGRRGRPGYALDDLVAAAAVVFTERGYDGTSMEDLAGRLGLSKSALYHHVSGKAELLRLATDRALDALSAVLDDPPGDTAVVRLEHVVRESVLVLTRELPYVTLLLRVRGNTDVERRALTRRRDLDHRLTDLVRAAQTDGDLRPDLDPALTARLVFGTVNSLVEWYRPTRGPSPHSLAGTVVTLALDGLRAPGPR